MAYEIVIRVTGVDQASGPLGNVSSALGDIGKFAAGGLIASGISNLAGGIMDLGRQALASVSNYERAAASIETLLAKEIKNASGIETTIKVGQERLQLTQQEIAQLGKLRDSLATETLQRDIQAAKIQEQKERIRQLTDQYGENGLVVIKERAELALMEQAYAKSGTAIEKYGSQIAALEGKQGKLVDVTQKVVEGQLSMTEALAQAGPKAAALLQWTEQLAIKSPFTSADITDAMKVAMAYGFTSDQSKALTENIVDLASAMGWQGSEIKDVSLIMGQINKSDKLLMQDMRQLTMRGVDVESVLKKMGYSLSDVGEKAIDSKKFVSLMMESWKTDFGGTADRMANSLPGLLSSLGEIKDLGLRDLFTGMFNAAKPLLTDLVGLFTSTDFRAGVQNIGAQLGTALTQGIGFVKTNVLPVLQTLGNWFTTTGLPALRTFAAVAGPLLQNALSSIGSLLSGQVLPVFMQFANVIGGATQERFVILGNFIQNMLPILGQLGAWVMTTLVPAFLGLASAFATYVLPPMLQFGNFVLNVLLNGVVQLASWIASSLLPALTTMGETIATAALPVLSQMGGWIQGTLIPAFQQLAAFVGPILQTAFAWLGGFITGTLLPALTTLIVWILQKGLPGLGDLAAIIGGVLNGALATLGNLWKGIVENFNKAVTFIADTTANLQTLANAITSSIGAAFQWLNDTILQPLAQTFNWLVGLAESFMEWLQKIADALANMQIPDFLQRHSPSPLEQALMYSNQHLKAMAGLLPGSLGALGGYGAPGALGFAYANGGLATRGAPTDARRTVNINGNVSIGNADAAREFWRLMNEWENRIAADARLIG